MATIAHRLRLCAETYERAELVVSPHERIRALREARSELFDITSRARRELDQLILKTPAKVKPRKHVWFEIQPEPEVLAYWRKFERLKYQTQVTLAKLGIKDLDALEQLSPEALLRTTWVGKNTLREMEDVLLDHGRVFRGKDIRPLSPPQEYIDRAMGITAKASGA